MKYLISILSILTITLVSCEKEYTCSCKEVETSTGKVKRTWTPSKQTFDNRGDAETWCYGNEISGFGIRIECELK